MPSHETLVEVHEAQTAKLLEAVETAHSVTVEFGTGEYPLFEAVMGARTFDEDDLYIGVNIDSKQHKLLTEKLGDDPEYRQPGFAIHSKLTDGVIESLPLPDECVDTVLMANVLGEPDSQHIMYMFKDSAGKYQGNSDIDAKTHTVREAVRILRPGGHLAIVEDNTPYMGAFEEEKHGGSYYDATVRLLEVNGLSNIEAFDRQNGFADAVASFKQYSEHGSPYSYLVIGEKPNP